MVARRERELEALKSELMKAGGEGNKSELEDVKIRVVSDEDFAKMTESGSGKAVTVFLDGDATIIVSASADPSVMREEGIHVLQAHDGAHALEMLRENPEAVDIVLLDLTMPRMGGREAFRHIRTDRPELPVVLMSGYEEESTLQDLAGVALFLHKPFRKTSLTWTLHRALERRARTIAGSRG